MVLVRDAESITSDGLTEEMMAGKFRIARDFKSAQQWAETWFHDDRVGFYRRFAIPDV